MPVYPYGPRDYLGEVRPGDVKHMLLRHSFGVDMSIDECRFVVNGRARFFAVIISLYGAGREGALFSIELCNCSRVWDLSHHYLVAHHHALMRAALLGVGPLAHLVHARQEDSDSEE